MYFHKVPRKEMDWNEVWNNTFYTVAIIPPFVFCVLAVFEGSYILFERTVALLIR